VRLILVRHALPRRSRGGDGADPELTALGHRQAGRVAEALARVELDAVYTSPQRRARQTAAPLLEARGLAAEVVPGLAEYDAGDRAYVPVHLMAEADPAAWRRMREQRLPAHVDVPAFTGRVTAALGGIASAHPGTATVACFAHAGTINVYLAELLGLARPLTFPLDYAGITRVAVSRDGRRSVRTVNEVGHVEDLLDPALEPDPEAGEASVTH
jgi:2,3-bisphosphoglycerate-dependent phosphoglycerate mutase